ncbi:MAG: EVE domain-containing protein [Pseudomonadota bacterium]
MHYWLMKSEPDTFGIDDLRARPKQTEHWDGVRNYQARNMLRDQMKKGDLAFFYHSNCKEPGIVGIVEIVRQAYPDSTALDPENPHFDPKSTPEAPRWYMVDVRFRERFKRTITLAELKNHRALAELILLRKGNRLSIMPISAAAWRYILKLE